MYYMERFSDHVRPPVGSGAAGASTSLIEVCGAALSQTELAMRDA